MFDLKDVLEGELVSVGLVPANAHWSKLFGGRTNRVWRIQTDSIDLVCKLYSDEVGNLLFPNDPLAEKACLQGMFGLGFVPRLDGFHVSSLGAVILYDHLDGLVWENGVVDVAKLLGKVHDAPAPNCVRRLDVGVLERGDQLLQGCIDQSLSKLRPLNEVPLGRSCLIHTDVVPANLIVTSDGLKLIDWQCPAVGDPCEDLASFLSPAMQFLYRGSILNDLEREQFLRAYPDQGTVQRFRVAEAAYLWRMACYCGWRAEVGEAGYRAAQKVEVARLQQITQQR